MSDSCKGSKGPKQNSTSSTSLRPGSGPKQAATKAELEVLRQKAAELASKDPQKAATILSGWVNGRSERVLSPKKAG
jgi:hypothetical protein